MLRFRGMLRQHGLTEQQWRVLRALSTDQVFEIPRLAKATFLLGPSLSRILADLGTEGLISVELHDTDQRRKMIRLTEPGADLIARIAPLSEAIYADIAATVGADRMGEMQALLRDMETALRTAPPADEI